MICVLHTFLQTAHDEVCCHGLLIKPLKIWMKDKNLRSINFDSFINFYPVLTIEEGVITGFITTHWSWSLSTTISSLENKVVIIPRLASSSDMWIRGVSVTLCHCHYLQTHVWSNSPILLRMRRHVEAGFAAIHRQVIWGKPEVSVTSEAAAPQAHAVAAEASWAECVEVWVSEAKLLPGEVAVVMPLALDLA